jgi:hypothetical protein
MSAEAPFTRACGNGDPKHRGPNCRTRETAEQDKRDALVTVAANKAMTDQAAKLDSDLAAVRTRLEKAPAMQATNPLAAALEPHARDVNSISNSRSAMGFGCRIS